MADWQNIAPVSYTSLMAANDARLQQVSPQWPTGGTAAQFQAESNFNPSAVSPTGAQGIAQFEPKTAAAINEQNGTNLDPTNPLDALQLHYLLTKQLLNQYGGNPTSAMEAYNSGTNPAKWNNPETNKYITNINQNLHGKLSNSGDSGGWQDVQVPKQATSDPNSGWSDVTPPANNSIWENIKAAGLQGANLVAGAVESPFVGAYGVEQAIQHESLGAGVNAANQAFQTLSPENALNKMGVTTSNLDNTTISNLANKGMNFAFNTVPNVLGEGLERTAELQAGLSPSDYNPTNAKTAADLLRMQMLAAPVADIPHLINGVRGLSTGDVAARQAELDKMSGANTPPEPPPQTMDEMMQDADRNNAASQAKDIADQAEIAQQTVNANQQALRDQAQVTATGETSDYNQMEAQQAGQGDLFTAPGKTLDQLKSEYGYDLQPSGTQSELFSNNNAEKPYDQYGLNPNPVPLTQEDFGHAVTALASTEGTRFHTPEDMDGAYQQYLQTTSDAQGNLFDRPTIAKNFSDLAQQEATSRFVESHPIVMANQAKVDDLTQQLGYMQDQASNRKSPFDQQLITAKTSELRQAQTTLDTSKTNLASSYENATPHPYTKDGVTYMNSGLPLPDWIKNGLAKMLQAIHGVAFKFLDRKLSGPKNLNSFGDLLKQGIADRVNREASRTWETKPSETAINQIKQVPGITNAIKEFNPTTSFDLPPDQLKNQMMEAPDLTDGIGRKISQNVSQGGLMLTNVTKNPIVKYVADTVDRAATNAQQWVKQNLTAPKIGLLDKILALNKTELTGIRSFMELHEGQAEFTADNLAKRGYSPKQIDYYQKSIALNREAFDTYNHSAEASGLPKMDYRMGHIAGQFMGDFKRLILDTTKKTARNPEGTVIAVIPGNTRGSVEAFTKRFMENHPDTANLTTGKIQYIPLKESSGAADTRFHSFMQTIHFLAETNTDTKLVLDSMNQYFGQDASRLMGMTKFSKDKQTAGVIGAQGRKIWQSAEKNAVDGARAQLKYLDSMKRWSEMQNAAQKAKTFLTDPDLVNNKPNAVKAGSDYLDGVLGRNRGVLTNLVNAGLNTFSEHTGIGPSVIRSWNNNVKTAMLAKFVGIFKLSHSLVTLSQPLQAIPALDSLIHARGGEITPAMQMRSMAKAIASSTNIWLTHFGKSTITDPFVLAADNYRKANGVFDVNMSNHLQNVTSRGMNTARHIGELNISIPEAGARSFTYMYYAHMLNDLGLDKDQVFPTARNLMRYAMVDYSPHERPLMFGKMGLIGDMASTLSRFKFNTLSQHMVAGGESSASIKPILTLLGTSAFLGGVRGIIGYQAANYMVEKASELMADLNMIKQPTSLNEMLLKSLHGVNTHAADMLNFGGYSAIGLNLTGSFNNSDIIPSDPLSAMVPYGQEVADMASSAWNVVTKHNKASVEQAAHAWAPNSISGMMEDSFFTSSKTNPDGTHNYTNPNNLQLDARRTPTEMAERALSFRPLNESKNNFVSQVQGEKDKQLTNVSDFMFNKAKSDYYSQGGHLTPQQWQDYSNRDIQLGGQDFQTEFMKYLQTGVTRDRLERTEGIPSSNLQSLYKYQNVQGMK